MLNFITAINLTLTLPLGFSRICELCFVLLIQDVTLKLSKFDGDKLQWKRNSNGQSNLKVRAIFYVLLTLSFANFSTLTSLQITLSFGS